MLIIDKMHVSNKIIRLKRGWLKKIILNFFEQKITAKIKLFICFFFSLRKLGLKKKRKKWEEEEICFQIFYKL